jgi:hypothetical protein
MMAIFLFQQLVRSISRFFCREPRCAQGDEELQRDATLVLRFQRATDIAEGARSAQEHVGERACEQAVQRCRLGGKQIGQGGQMRVVFVRLQRGLSFPRRIIYSPIPISIGIPQLGRGLVTHAVAIEAWGSPSWRVLAARRKRKVFPQSSIICEGERG